MPCVFITRTVALLASSRQDRSGFQALRAALGEKDGNALCSADERDWQHCFLDTYALCVCL